ncbi:ADP-ribosylglycohydrolase family protein [Cellulomonas sp. zg-ZUI199]|nr:MULTISPECIES: ADP-ribosylglycohydrolase family protein [Cellulomonas]MBO0898923.1 ADP-ribosylglycohydrolase family protein [Cellulomonas sp. zg-ZUI22]MBO0923790.1 ADP-ribosylglycohydrolase family protein [Cellulomonas wangleii]MBO0924072.1 ADP-ribosylglycohydrolase family protein [Cellulomonas wangleii]
MKLTPVQIDRAVGALLGSAAGDALGAGYEFGPPLPDDAPVVMKGGGGFGWEPGEWTDDTSMAIPIAQVLADGGSLDDEGALDRIVAAWFAWAAEAKDVGKQTSMLMRAMRTPSAAAARQAASAQYLREPDRSGGNGTLMRTGPVALGYLDDGAERALANAARAVSDLTHGDPDAGDACVLWSLAIRHAIRTGEIDLVGQLAHLPAARRERWAAVIAEAESSQPRDFPKNGWVVQALQGAWSAIHHGDGLVDVLERAVRGGKDTDTVAAIAGALVGAAYGGTAVPARWRRILHGWPGINTRGLVELGALAVRGGQPDSLGWPVAPQLSGTGVRTLVTHPHDEGVVLASLDGLVRLPDDVTTVVSMCRVGRRQTSREHVEFWLVDQDGANADVDAVLIDAADTIAELRAQGQRVALHCVEARSRTSAVAAVYAIRHRGVPKTEALAALEATLPDYEPKQFLLDAVGRIAENVAGEGDEETGPESTEPALRFTIAQSWWIASELARRNGLEVYEDQPCGYDVLGVRRAGTSGGGASLEMNRGGRLHIHPAHTGWMTWQEVLAQPDPHAVVRRAEKTMGLSPQPHQKTTRRSLTYRVIARALAGAVDDRHPWDVRIGFQVGEDLSEDFFYGLESSHPAAVAHARTLTSSTGDVEARRHLWILGHNLRRSGERHVAAVLSDDARVFLAGDAEPIDLMALYRKRGHRLGLVVAEALGAVLP